MNLNTMLALPTLSDADISKATGIPTARIHAMRAERAGRLTLEPMSDAPAQNDSRELINFTARVGYGRSAR